MATAQQVNSLVKALVENDDEKFRTFVLQIAAYETKAGHANAARELKIRIGKIMKKSSFLRFDTGNPLFLFNMPSFLIRNDGS